MGINRRKGKKTKQISILGRARVGDNTLHVHQCFFSFFGYQNFAKFHPNVAKLVKFTLAKHNFPNFFVEKWRNFTKKK